MSCQAADMQIEWQGKNEQETGINVATGKTIVTINPQFYRPTEVDLLLGSYDKAQKQLGWEPTTTLESLCQMMVDADMQRNEHGQSF